MRGIVKWFDEKKGFGFISCANESTQSVNEYFAHYKQIDSVERFKNLREDDEVEFTPGKGEKGPVALKIKKIL